MDAGECSAAPLVSKIITFFRLTPAPPADRHYARRPMPDEVVVIKSSPTRRRAIEGSLGILAGIVFACFNGPTLLSWFYTPPAGDALSCGPTINNALAFFVQLQLGFGLVGGALLLVGSFLVRRALRKRGQGGAAVT
jgi:hypothetical protein